jgi:hypothetical protein
VPHTGHFTLGRETQFPLYRRLGGPWGWSGWVWKISLPTGFQTQNCPAHMSCYTTCYDLPLKRWKGPSCVYGTQTWLSVCGALMRQKSVPVLAVIKAVSESNILGLKTLLILSNAPGEIQRILVSPTWISKLTVQHNHLTHTAIQQGNHHHIQNPLHSLHLPQCLWCKRGDIH